MPAQCSSIGASICYLLSKTLFSNLVERSLKDRLAMWANQVRRNRNTIFSYMLFLRVTPFFPNWFINIASPHVGVPLPVFFVATFIGTRLARRFGEPCRPANQAGSPPPRASFRAQASSRSRSCRWAAATRSRR